jgi:hypothetical protein
MPHVKPAGQIGPISITGRGQTAHMVWQTVPFPVEKENIEKDIMRLFCAEWSKQGVLVIWSKNQEDHFDFTLHFREARSSLI